LSQIFNLFGTKLFYDKAHFERSILKKVDFRTAYYFNIDPENNYLQGAKFSLENVSGLLTKYQVDIS